MTYRLIAICWAGLLLAAQTLKDLTPPQDQRVLLTLKGKGGQIYVCQSSGATFAWVFKAPAAKLFGESGEQVGKHFAGPTWEANDGSRVTGKVKASMPSPDAGAIPWLLLTASSSSGSGIFGKVQSIQRLETKGGKAPGEACDLGKDRNERTVPYEADYVFFGGH